MSTGSRIGAVVLAAGMSSRMGKPKQLLKLGERTVLDQTLENLRSARLGEIILVLGFMAEEIARQVALDGVRVVVNQQYGEGMGSSLRTGLAALSSDVQAAFVVLGDQPLVRPATLHRMIARYVESGAQIAIPTYLGFRGNPVLLDRSVFAEVMTLTGDIGCRAIFGNHTAGIVKVQVEDFGILLDIDNADDFERLQRFARGAVSANQVIVGADLSDPSPDHSSKDNLILVGAEPVGLALAKLGRMMGFHVTIVDPLVTASSAPEADDILNTLDFSQLTQRSSPFVVVATHGRFDEEAVDQALKANAAYIGMVANQRRAQEVLRALEEKGHARESLTAVHAPAGLNIQAESAEEIALSIMAEIVLEKNKRRPA